MSIKKITFIVFVFFLHFTIIGQTLDTIVLLDDVELMVKKQIFLVGSRIEKVDSIKLHTVSGGTLTNLISRYLPIYIKQDAGGLSTIHFRGTSPDHTAIMFGGLNINSLTLGHSNMSNIPVFLFDDVKVQFGSSSSLYGTDAIGGSIQLDNKPKWNKGLSTEIQQDIGSFGSYFTGLKFGYSNKKIQYLIKAFYQNKENDFPFLNTAVKDFEKDRFVEDVQKNASIKNFGILQEFNYKISDKFYFYTKQWYQNNWREIQPNMSENYYGTDYKEIENNNLRIISGLNYQSGKYKINSSIGYVYDYQLYDNNHNQKISTQSVISNVNYFISDFLYGDFNAGINYSYLTSDVYAYAEDVKENRLDFYTSYIVKLIQKLSMAINLRESIVFDYTSQFAPSIGFDYKFVETNVNTFTGSATIAKSFKIPTFNDRFWYPNGNPDILPEKGMNYEIGSTYKLKKGKGLYQMGVSFFMMNIDDWIQWVPLGDMWRPQNYKMVQSMGAEFNFSKTCKLSDDLDLNWGVNYSFTDVSDVDSFWQFNFSERKQLPYTPKHIVNMHTSIYFKSWYFNFSGPFTGSRLTENGDDLKGYFLVNTTIGKNFSFSKNKFSIHLNVNNLFDVAYQNQAYYAMPGRNLSLSLKYIYN